MYSLLTIYTPCYNKSKTIRRTFNSLLNQTNHNFEWIIINDGSEDNSAEEIDSFETDLFNIKKVHKKNEGLSSVMNLAVEMSESEFILRLDGDDWLTPNAVNVIYDKLKKYDLDNCKLGGIVFLTMYDNGSLCGFHPFSKPTQCNFWDYRNKFRATGDRAEVFRTKCFKEFPMPSFENERFVLESYVWNHFSDKYDVIYYNIPIYIREYNELSISNNWPIIGIKNPKGMQLVLKDILNRRTGFKVFFISSVNYYRYSLHTNYGVLKLIRDIPIISTILGIVPGVFLYLIERKHTGFIKKIKSLFDF